METVGLHLALARGSQGGMKMDEKDQDEKKWRDSQGCLRPIAVQRAVCGTCGTVLPLLESRYMTLVVHPLARPTNLL